MTLKATVASASSCTFSSTKPVAGLPYTEACSSGTYSDTVPLLTNTGTTIQKYTFDLSVTDGTTTVNATPVKVRVAPGDGSAALAGAKSIVSDVADFCAVLTTGGVDCWGEGYEGELGNGSPTQSDVPVAVHGVNGSGLLDDVKSVVGTNGGFCAVLTGKATPPGGVDCWGREGAGGVPAAVITSAGNLSGAIKVISAQDGSFCALLGSGGVDCWGNNGEGQLGSGTTGTSTSTAEPVVGTAGIGSTLGGVTALISAGEYSGQGNYCALLGSGGVDCWGYSLLGQLGNGTMTHSAVPVWVTGVGGTGQLASAVGVVGSNGITYCAVLAGGGVDCWGSDDYGDLGAGSYSGPQTCPGSNICASTPVQVVSTAGIGSTLSGVKSLGSDGQGFCAVLTSPSGAVDCWGDGSYGLLGNTESGVNSDLPVQVFGVAGTGTLSGAHQVVDNPTLPSTNYCAVLTTKGVDCWGYAAAGQLGNGSNAGLCQGGNNCPASLVPVQVVSPTGSGTLTGVKHVVEQGTIPGRLVVAYCALLTTGGVDCWGMNWEGELGDGPTTYSFRPEPVLAAT